MKTAIDVIKLCEGQSTYQVFMSKKSDAPVWVGTADSREDAVQKAHAAGKIGPQKMKMHQDGTGSLHVVQKRGQVDRTDWRHANDLDTSPFGK